MPAIIIDSLLGCNNVLINNKLGKKRGLFLGLGGPFLPQKRCGEIAIDQPDL
jgi:hypothetical protein